MKRLPSECAGQVTLKNLSSYDGLSLYVHLVNRKIFQIIFSIHDCDERQPRYWSTFGMTFHKMLQHKGKNFEISIVNPACFPMSSAT